MLTRKEIREFLSDDRAISQAWQKILDEGKAGNVSFEELAGRIDIAVSDRYEESFEQLSRLPANPALPSAAIAEKLRDYAEHWLDASRTLVEGLRAHNPELIREALEMAREAPQSNPPDTKELSRSDVQGKAKREN